MTSRELIEQYKEIKSIKQICEELEINYGNLMNEKTTKENENKVLQEITKEILMMYVSLFQYRRFDNVN